MLQEQDRLCLENHPVQSLDQPQDRPQDRPLDRPLVDRPQDRPLVDRPLRLAPDEAPGTCHGGLVRVQFIPTLVTLQLHQSGSGSGTSRLSPEPTAGRLDPERLTACSGSPELEVQENPDPFWIPLEGKTFNRVQIEWTRSMSETPSGTCGRAQT
ncbi:uncharacterized protein V6R79_009106 [Siganus canaliculatus]